MPVSQGIKFENLLFIQFFKKIFGIQNLLHKYTISRARENDVAAGIAQ
jgi:hypothetical protein